MLQTYYYYYHVSNLIVSANSSVNFIIYCVLRRQFRLRLQACCLGSRRQDMTTQNDSTSAFRLRVSSDHDRNPATSSYQLLTVQPRVTPDCNETAVVVFETTFHG